MRYARTTHHEIRTAGERNSSPVSINGQHVFFFGLVYVKMFSPSYSHWRDVVTIRFSIIFYSCFPSARSRLLVRRFPRFVARECTILLSSTARFAMRKRPPPTVWYYRASRCDRRKRDDSPDNRVPKIYYCGGDRVKVSRPVTKSPRWPYSTLLYIVTENRVRTTNGRSKFTERRFP